MVKYDKELAKWLRESNFAFYNQYQDMFQNGRDVFSLLGDSFSDKNITPKDLVARLQSELPLVENKDVKTQSLFRAYATPINPNFLGLLVRAADVGTKVNDGCPRYETIKNELSAAYRINIIENPNLRGIIAYKTGRLKAFFKIVKYNFMLRRAKRLEKHGKTFSIKKLNLHSIKGKIHLDNEYTGSMGITYSVGDNEKLLNVVNAFAKNLTNIFFDRKGKYFIDHTSDKTIKAATTLFATLFVSRAMNWGDININSQIEDTLKIQIAQTLSSLKVQDGNLAMKKIREETIEVTKYMMGRQGLTLENFVTNSQRMGVAFQTVPTTLEEAMFGKKVFETEKEFAGVHEETATHSKEKLAAEEEKIVKAKPHATKSEPKKVKAETHVDKEENVPTKGTIKIRKMDVIREISKQIDESFDKKEDLFYDKEELVAGNVGWYFNAYQSVINKTPNSSYTKISNLRDFKTNPELKETREQLLKSLAQSVVQTGKSKEIEFTKKQLADLQGEWIANQMIETVTTKLDKNITEVEVPAVVKKSRSTQTEYNEMISNACEKLFSEKTGKSIKQWITDTVFEKEENILEREKNLTPKTIRKIEEAGITID